MTNKPKPEVVDVLIVEDDAGLQEALQDTLLLAGLSCAALDSAESAMVWLQANTAKLVITDVQMAGMSGLGLLEWINRRLPGLPVLVITAYAQVAGAVAAIRAGAIDYLAKPFTPEALLAVVDRYVSQQAATEGEPVVGDASSIQLLQLAKRVAESGASVMITGPSGTGKEVLARFIHQQSSRAQQDFVAINCAAIPESMLEAILFGYEKGAFTGAMQASPGKFEQANGGTLLLDEITEMDLNLQAKLLRVLQEREVERLGGRQPIALDVRVLATSNRDLRQAVADGQFREDLFYRLNVFPLHWPALAERPGDILPLANYLMQREASELNRSLPTLTANAQARLTGWHWPGNVRELSNVIQRALILAQGEQITEDDILLDQLFAPTSSAKAAAPQALASNTRSTDLDTALLDQEQRVILQALKSHGGSRQQVAEQLGISPRTLRYKLARMREAGIEV